MTATKPSADAQVRATCPVCAHSRVIDPSRVCYPRGGALSGLGPVLRCSRCGKLGLAVRVWPPHEGPAAATTTQTPTPIAITSSAPAPRAT